MIEKVEDILAEITNSAITAIRKMTLMACNDIPREASMDQTTKVSDSIDSKICRTRQIMAISSTNKIIIIITGVEINRITTREDSRHEKRMIIIIREIMLDAKDQGVEIVETINLMEITKMIKKEGDFPKIRIKATNSIEITVKADSIITMKIIVGNRISKEGAILIAVITLIRDIIKTISTTIAIKTDTTILMDHSAIQQNMN